MDLRLDGPPGRTARAVQGPPCAMVIFGSSGDLTKRLLIPALYNLAKAGRLSDKFALIGVDRTDRSHEEFRAYLAEGVRSFVSDTGTGPVTAPFDARAWEFLAARMTHLKGDVTDPEMYDRLAQALKEAESEHGTAGNVVFYLAVAASLFGPVVAAAVVLNPQDRIRGLRDSKLLLAERREVLAERIRERALCFAIAAVDSETIDAINIYQASRLAMLKAVEQLSLKPDHLLIDAMQIEYNCSQTKIIHGDALSVSIAAASIIAKVERDSVMMRSSRRCRAVVPARACAAWARVVR